MVGTGQRAGRENKQTVANTRLWAANVEHARPGSGVLTLDNIILCPINSDFVTGALSLCPRRLPGTNTGSAAALKSLIHKECVHATRRVLDRVGPCFARHCAARARIAVAGLLSMRTVEVSDGSTARTKASACPFRQERRSIWRNTHAGRRARAHLHVYVSHVPMNQLE